MNSIRTRFARFGLSLVAVAAGLLLRIAIEHWTGPGLATYITFYPAVMLAALMAGFWPGIVATLATVLVVDFFFLGPPLQFGVERLIDIVGQFFFAGMGVLMSAVAGLYRRIRSNLGNLVEERTRELRDANAALKQQVELVDPARADVIMQEMQRVVRARRDAGAPRARAVPAIDWLQRWSTMSGVIVAVVGLLVLIGWSFNVSSLLSFVPGLATMKANTALCFLLAGAALVLRERRLLRAVFAAGVCGIAAITFLEYACSADFVIDQFLFADPGNPQTVYLGRMVPATAIGFLLTGASLLLLGVRKRAGRWLQQSLASVAAVLGVIAILGYIYEVQELYNFAGPASMALNTALGFVVLSLGLIFARPDGLGRVLTAPGPGAQVARRLLPVAILLPLFLGWLHEMGEKIGVFPPTMGAGLLSLVMMLSFVMVIWWIAQTLDRTDAARRDTETQLRNQAELMDHSQDALVVREMNGAIRFWNNGAVDLYGWPAAEALGQRIHVLLRTENLPPDYETKLEQSGHWEGELTHIARDGRRVIVESRKTAVRDADGRLLILESNRDITERKRAEDALREGSERDAFRVALGEALRPLNDVQEIKIAAVRVLGQYLRASRVAYGEITPEGDVIMERGYTDGVPDIAGRYRLADYGPALLSGIRAGRNIVVADVASDPSFTEEEKVRYRALQVAGNLNVPLVKEGRTVALLAVNQAAPRQWTDKEVSLVEETVEWTWSTVERARAEAAVRESETRLRRFYESSLMGVIYWNMNGEITDANDEFLKMVGYSREDLVAGRIDWIGMTPPEYRHLDEASSKELKATGVNKQPFEKEYIRKDGSRLPILVAGAMLDEARFNGVAFVLDITERKRAEDALRESEARVRRKLDSVLLPEGDLGTLELSDIIDVPAIQKLMDHFYSLAGFPMTIMDLKGKVLVGVGWQEICMRFHRAHPDACRNCVESDLQLTAGVPPGEAKLYKCKNNMWDIATPILVGGRHVGNLFSGQFFFDDEQPDVDLFRAQARQYGFKEDEYIAAMEAVPRFSRATVDTGMAFLMKLADILSHLSYGNVKLARLLAERDILLASIKESEEQLRRAQEIAHLGSWALDLTGNRLSWSDEVYRIFGLSPQEFSATYEAFLERVHPDDRDSVNEAYSSSLRENRDSYEIEHRVVRKDTGEIRVVHEKCEHFRDAGGKIVRSVGMVHDITERKKTEEAIRRVNENLEQFAYVASHDLQEPLRIMSSYSQLLGKRYKTKLDKDADEFIDYIVDAAARMQKLITDLLAYSRAGHKEVALDDVDCDRVVKRVVESMAATIGAAGGNVTFDPLPVIRAHEASMTQLFQNLIANALKFRGDAPPAIHVGAKRSEAGWVFSVRDNGIGIEPQYFERIFVIFQRLHARDKYAGTGIGLSICRKIVENLGGRIWVESEAGKGSTFYFTVPEARVKND